MFHNSNGFNLLKFITTGFLLFQALCLAADIPEGGVPAEYTFDQLQTLFDSGTALTLEQIPATGTVVKFNEVLIEYPTTSYSFKNIFSNAPSAPGKRNVLIAANVYQGPDQLPDAQLLAQSAGCTSVIPSATVDTSMNALVAWRNFSNTRQMTIDQETKRLIGVYSGRTLWRTSRQLGKTMVIARTDLLDLGFSFGNEMWPMTNRIGIAYSYTTDELIPITPDPTVKAPNCGLVSYPYLWEQVDSPASTVTPSPSNGCHAEKVCQPPTANDLAPICSAIWVCP